MRLAFEEVAPNFTNSGKATLRVGVLSADGGTLTVTAGRTPGDGQSTRFPSFDSIAPAPRAVVQVTNVDSTDHLNPGNARFEFGTDFIDVTSADLDKAALRI